MFKAIKNFFTNLFNKAKDGYEIYDNLPEEKKDKIEDTVKEAADKYLN